MTIFFQLGSNKIASMEDGAFKHLPLLKNIAFESNICINQRFSNINRDSFLKLISSFCGVDKRFVACETIEAEFDQFRCHMQSSTAITTRSMSLSDEFNVDMFRIIFDGNKNIQFLPISMNRNFPNLLAILASNCSIIEISKESFEKLTELEILNLAGNKIYSIWSDTFNDLKALTKLYLGKNFFKFYIFLYS